MYLSAKRCLGLYISITFSGVVFREVTTILKFNRNDCFTPALMIFRSALKLWTVLCFPILRVLDGSFHVAQKIL